MNMFKKNGGFTLVELIVVIAILAILAGVAVPAYNGYITKAKDAAAITQLDAVATAAQAAYAQIGSVDKITVSAADGTVAIEPTQSGDTATKVTADFVLFYGKDKVDTNILKDSSYKNGAEWTNAGGWVAKTADNNVQGS